MNTLGSRCRGFTAGFVQRLIHLVLALALLGPVVACPSPDAGPTPVTGPSPVPAPSTPSPSAQLVTIHSGSGQTGRVAAPLPVPVAVRVSDASGRAVAGASVTFTTSSGGQLATAASTTGADGVASAGAWTLGTTAGRQQVTAVVAGTALSTSLDATATPDIPARLAIVVPPPDTIQLRRVPTRAPVVQVTDRYGNPVPARTEVSVRLDGVPIAVLAGGTAATDSVGRARFDALRLGVGTTSTRDTLPDARLVFAAPGLVPATSQRVDMECYAHRLPTDGGGVADSWEPFDCLMPGGVLDASYTHAVVVGGTPSGQALGRPYAAALSATVAASLAFVDSGAAAADDYVPVGSLTPGRLTLRLWTGSAPFAVLPTPLHVGVTGRYSLDLRPDSSALGCLPSVLLPGRGITVREQLRADDCAEPDGTRSDWYLLSVPSGAALTADLATAGAGLGIELRELPGGERETSYATLIAGSQVVDAAGPGGRVEGTSVARRSTLVALRVRGRAPRATGYEVRVAVRRAGAQVAGNRRASALLGRARSGG